MARKKRITQPAGIPNYVLGPTYQASGGGAGNFIFEQEFSNPVLVFVGPGIIAGQMNIVQPPQVYVARPSVAYSGLGGNLAGISALQGLEDSE